MEALLEQLTAARADAEGITTGLAGAGGFGKTTLARMLVHSARTREAFPEGIVWATLGQDVAGPDLADRIDDLCAALTGVKPPYTDPILAGTHLGAVLAERRVLLVIDDVWSTAQLEPFQVGGARAMRLVTTRQRSVLPSDIAVIDVDAMTPAEAQDLLGAGLGPVTQAALDRLLAATGCWPVLLGLVNGAARSDVSHGASNIQALADIYDQLRAGGITVLDVENPDTRSQAVSATLDVSFTRLSAQERARYLDLAVFDGDADIPLPVVARYWHHTGGWTQPLTRNLCRKLADLSLLATYRLDQPRLRVHDVICAYLRHLTGDRLPGLHAAVLEAHRDLVTVQGGETDWSQLPPEESYLWERVPVHLRTGGLRDELDATVRRPGWLAGKLQQFGPAALEADLNLSRDSTCRALATAVRQNAHILGPLEPPGSVAATFASRIPTSGSLAPIAAAIQGGLAQYLSPAQPLPDLPLPALNRVLTGHDGIIVALSAASDGSWLASASYDGTVRVWDLAGDRQVILTGHIGSLHALAVAPDGSWLASGGNALGPNQDGAIALVWDATTGTPRHTLAECADEVHVLAVAPDGSWLASAGGNNYGAPDYTVQVWDIGTGNLRHNLTGHKGMVEALAVAPDGSWLASAGGDRTIRVWEMPAGTLRHNLTGHEDAVRTLAVAPDGSWLASAGRDRTIRVWEMPAGNLRHNLTGHEDAVRTLAVAPDGSWLASGSGNYGEVGDNSVRIWSIDSGTGRHILAGHTKPVHALAIAPNGSWLASGGDDGAVRFWDVAAGTPRQILTGHTGAVSALTMAPDGSWLASASEDRTIRIWDTAAENSEPGPPGDTPAASALAVAPDGSWLAEAGVDGIVRVLDLVAIGRAPRYALIGHTQPVLALAVAPDGSWLASAGGSAWDENDINDNAVRIWDMGDGALRHALTGHDHAVTLLTAAPDGSWLASGGGAPFGDSEVRVWDTTSGTLRYAFTDLTGSVTALAAAPDGSWLASASGSWSDFPNSDAVVRVWNMNDGALRFAFTGEALSPRGSTKWFHGLAAAPDGSWLASVEVNAQGLRNGTVRVWDIATGELRLSLVGEPSEGWSLAVAPDGSWLASAGGHPVFDMDKTIRFWDMATGAPRHTHTGDAGMANELAVTPDGTWLASAGRDGTVRIWAPDTGEAIAAIRVDSPLFGLALAGRLLIASGARGCYYLRLERS